MRLREDGILIVEKGYEGVNCIKRIHCSVVKEDHTSCRSRNGLAVRTVKFSQRVWRCDHTTTEL